MKEIRCALIGSGHIGSESKGLARDILVELGREKMIGGQAAMIIDTAMTMAKERGLLKDATAGVAP